MINWRIPEERELRGSSTTPHVLDFHGLHQFPPSTATFLTFGFVPTTATMELMEHGTINIFAIGPAPPVELQAATSSGLATTVATVYSRLSVADRPGQRQGQRGPARCGTPLRDPAIRRHIDRYQRDATRLTTSVTGGPLTGMVTIPKFSNCGVARETGPDLQRGDLGPTELQPAHSGRRCASVLGGGVCEPKPWHRSIPSQAATEGYRLSMAGSCGHAVTSPREVRWASRWSSKG